MSIPQQVLLACVVVGPPIALAALLLLWPAYALCAAIDKAHTEDRPPVHHDEGNTRWTSRGGLWRKGRRRMSS